MSDSAIKEPTRECGWCHIPYHYWREIRCIETADDLVFCSACCMERYEAATGRTQEIVSELPFPWDRTLIADPPRDLLTSSQESSNT